MHLPTSKHFLSEYLRGGGRRKRLSLNIPSCTENWKQRRYASFFSPSWWQCFKLPATTTVMPGQDRPAGLGDNNPSRLGKSDPPGLGDNNPSRLGKNNPPGLGDNNPSFLGKSDPAGFGDNNPLFRASTTHRTDDNNPSRLGKNNLPGFGG